MVKMTVEKQEDCKFAAAALVPAAVVAVAVGVVSDFASDFVLEKAVVRIHWLVTAYFVVPVYWCSDFGSDPMAKVSDSWMK